MFSIARNDGNRFLVRAPRQCVRRSKMVMTAAFQQQSWAEDEQNCAFQMR
jgi:hypothetical protein